MAKNKFNRIVRPATKVERKRHEDIRRKVEKEFPPAANALPKPATDSLAAKFRRAREGQGLTWYAVAKLAGVPNSRTVRDIEAGRDAQLSSVQAIAAALGLSLKLVEVAAKT